MLLLILALWIISALFIVFERRVYRVIIYFAIFSLITSVGYLLLGSPDVAMAEAAISAFATIFFIIGAEKFYNRKVQYEKLKKNEYLKVFRGAILPLVFSAGLLALFISLMPNVAPSDYLKNQYLQNFTYDVGGENVVTAIYLGYRVYDTLFEALVLVVAVVAVAHLSFFDLSTVKDGHHNVMEKSSMAIFTMRIITPVILVFGIFLILNGHISPGGGFQGGLAVATFFICRYLIRGIYDIPVVRVIRLEEFVFIGITLAAIVAVFIGVADFVPEGFLPIFQIVYLISMNSLIGLKVACGFFILFYRYIAIERR